MKAPSPLSVQIWGTQEFRKSNHSKGKKSCLLGQCFAKPFTSKYYINSLRLKVKYERSYATIVHLDSIKLAEWKLAYSSVTEIVCHTVKATTDARKDLLRNTACDFHRGFQSQELHGHSNDSYHLCQILELPIHPWLSATMFTPPSPHFFHCRRFCSVKDYLHLDMMSLKGSETWLVDSRSSTVLCTHIHQSW